MTRIDAAVFAEPSFIDTNGIRMAVYEQGSGAPVILLHGFPELASPGATSCRRSRPPGSVRLRRTSGVTAVPMFREKSVTTGSKS